MAGRDDILIEVLGSGELGERILLDTLREHGAFSDKPGMAYEEVRSVWQKRLGFPAGATTAGVFVNLIHLLARRGVITARQTPGADRMLALATESGQS